VARFLSDEWIEEMAEAAAGDEELAAATAGVRVCVQQVVRGEPAVRYWLRVDDGTVRIGPGTLDDADVVFDADRPTATGLATGTLSVQDAVASGGLRISGDVAVVIRQATSLARVHDAFSTLRTRTTYD
jgi:hypothetical protein